MFEKLIGSAKGILNKITISELVLSVISLLIGLVFFTNSNINKLVVGILTGMIILAIGLINIYSYIKKDNIKLYSYNLILGVAISILGIITLFLSNYITILIGIFFIVIGIQKIVYGILLKQYNESSWLLIIVMGILFIILGIITFFTSIDALVNVTGIDLIGYSLINAVFLVLLRRRSEYFIL